MNNKPIAVVAFGVINPAARGIQAFEGALRTGVRHLDRMEPACSPRGKSLWGRINDPGVPARGRAFHLAQIATKEALSQWDPRTRVDPGEIAYFLSTISGESSALEAHALDTQLVGSRTYSWKAALASVPNGRLHHKLARIFGLTGPQVAISNTCASGNVSMGMALDMVREGRCRAAVISAVELCTLGTLWGADRAAILGTRLAPFDAHRDGAIFGEGAATVILADPALVSPDEVLGWVCGFGSSCDAENAAIAFQADGSGLYRAMALALDDADVKPRELDYVNAHAPGTPVIDPLECKAVYDLLGMDQGHLAINSTKSITSHLAGAGSVTEAVATIVQMNGDFLHGNAGLETVGTDMALTPVGSQAQHRPTRTAISNALGGGGLYTTVVFKRRDWRPTNRGERPRHQSVPVAIVGHSGWQRSNPQEDLTSRFPAVQPFAHMNRAAQLAVAAASEILDCQVTIPRQPNTGLTPDLGVFSATFLGGLPESLGLFLDLLVHQPKAIKPSTVLEHGVNFGGALIGRHHGLTGPNYSFVGSRVSSVQAICAGLSHLQASRIGAALITGFDATKGLENEWVSRSFGQIGRMVDATAGLLLKRADRLGTDEACLAVVQGAGVVRVGPDPRQLVPGLQRLSRLIGPLDAVKHVHISNYAERGTQALTRACRDVFGEVIIHVDEALQPDTMAAGPLLTLQRLVAARQPAIMLCLDEFDQIAGVLVRPGAISAHYY